MKKILTFLLLALMAMAVNAQQIEVDPDTIYTIHSMTQAQFKQVIADYDAREWQMRNERPVVVDFYADWCVPCRRLNPILRNIAHYYQGEVDFYRIDVDKNQDIAGAFQVRSIPYLLICPLNGEPKGITGLYPEQEYIRLINQVLER